MFSRARSSLAVLRVALASALVLAAPGAVYPAAARATTTEARGVHGVRVTRAYGWNPLDAGRLVLWLGIEEPYLVELGASCEAGPDPRYTAVTVHARHLAAGRDELLWEGGRCRIAALHRANPASLRSRGIRRENAAPLAVIDVAPAKRLR